MPTKSRPRRRAAIDLAASEIAEWIEHAPSPPGWRPRTSPAEATAAPGAPARTAAGRARNGAATTAATTTTAASAAAAATALLEADLGATAPVSTPQLAAAPPPAAGPVAPVAAVATPPDLLSPTSGIPWTPAAAARPLPPDRPPSIVRRSPALTVIVGVAVAAALLLLVISRLHLGGGGPSGLLLDGITVSSPDSQAAAGHVGGDAHEIDLDLAYQGASPGDSITIVFTSAPGTAPEGLPSQSFRFSSAQPAHGTLRVRFQAGGDAPFAPGPYSIEARKGNDVLTSVQFMVDPPAAAPAPSAAAPTAASSAASATDTGVAPAAAAATDSAPAAAATDAAPAAATDAAPPPSAPATATDSAATTTP